MSLYNEQNHHWEYVNTVQHPTKYYIDHQTKAGAAT